MPLQRFNCETCNTLVVDTRHVVPNKFCNQCEPIEWKKVEPTESWCMTEIKDEKPISAMTDDERQLTFEVDHASC